MLFVFTVNPKYNQCSMDNVEESQCGKDHLTCLQ